MDVRAMFNGQYHAALAMLRQTIERCPDGLWLEGENGHGVLAHRLPHAVQHRSLPAAEGGRLPALAGPPHAAEDLGDDEPPAERAPYAKDEILAYLDDLDSRIDAGVERVDLEASDCGFYRYSLNKLDHQAMNVRHVQQHVGQLSERLFAAGIETDWMGRRYGPGRPAQSTRLRGRVVAVSR